MKRSTTADDSFMDHAACTSGEADMFPTDTTGVARAKLVCARCHVSDACLDYAIERNIEHGVWGGMNESERRRIKRRRRAELRIVA